MQKKDKQKYKIIRLKKVDLIRLRNRLLWNLHMNQADNKHQDKKILKKIIYKLRNQFGIITDKNKVIFFLKYPTKKTYIKNYKAKSIDPHFSPSTKEWKASRR